MRCLLKQYRNILIPLVSIALALGFFRSVLFLGYVPSASMEPTIKEGSFVLGMRLFNELQTGDIIIFEHDRRLLVKRIAASPGESVVAGDGTAIVPENSYYVLGDNIDNSYDSRYWKDPFVPEKSIIAKLICP